MAHIQKFKKWERKVKMIGIPLIPIIMHISFSIAEGELCSINKFIIGFIYSYTLWQGNSVVFYRLREKFPELDHIKRRIALHVLFIPAYTLIIVFLVRTFIPQDDKDGTFISDFFIGSGITIFIVGLYLSVYFFEMLKDSVLESEKLKRAKAESDFAVLRNQVNPHFLFNSLNTLASIIPEEPELAVEYVQKLSDVFRYVLQSRDKDLVSIETELKIAYSYVFLLQIRHGDNLKVDFKIDELYYDYNIPPLALQMLIENSIKHNVISTVNPLEIKIILSEEGKLVVRNSLLPRIHNNGADCTGTGLENIKKRYSFLCSDKVEIEKNDEFFQVTLPLLKVEKYESINY